MNGLILNKLSLNLRKWNFRFFVKLVEMIYHLCRQSLLFIIKS